MKVKFTDKRTSQRKKQILEMQEKILTIYRINIKIVLVSVL